MTATTAVCVTAADGVVSPGLTGSPVWCPATNTPDCLWAIYATADERDDALDAAFRTWAALEDRSVLLNYALTWRDVHGFGLQLAHSAWPGRAGHVA